MGAVALQVSTDNGATWSSNAILTFVGGQTGQYQQVLVRAASPVPANDTYFRNETIVIGSTLLINGEAISQSTVKVTVESAATGLIIDQSLQPTTIVAGQTTYSYNLTLNKQPAPNEIVTVALTGPGETPLPSGIILSGANLTESGGIYYATFNAGDWNIPQQITVSAQTGTFDAQSVDIQQWISSTDSNQNETPVFSSTALDAGSVNLTVAATDTPGVLVLQPQGEAVVTPNQSYSYQLVLTGRPANGTTVNVALDGDGQTLAYVNGQLASSVTFDDSDWNTPVTVTLMYNSAYQAPSGGGQGSNPATDMTFPPQEHTLAGIAGPLIIDGGTQAGQPTLVSPVTLPYETHNAPGIEPTQGEGTGSGEVDTVKIFDDGTTAGETGYLTDIPALDEFGTPFTDPLNPEYSSGQGINISGLDLPGNNSEYDAEGNLTTSGNISHTSASTGITTTYEAA